VSTGPHETLLRLEGVSRAFGGIHAAEDVSFSVEAGSVHGLIGPNGAGKTTILNLISGLLRPDSGQILFRGERIDALPPYRIARLGIRRTYQGIRLFGAMTVHDNLIVGLDSRRSEPLWHLLWFGAGSRRAAQETAEITDAILRQTALSHRAYARARDLSYGEQRRLEIARALAGNPALLLLDEPVAGMSAAESEQVADLIRSLASGGMAVLLVEHNLELVMGVCSVITVLDFGHVLASGPPGVIRRDPNVIAAYLGVQD
jgi:ABC-type branched-subunit amino acid transport system ATPase component